MEKKLFTFDRIASILVVTLLGLIAIVAFASDIGQPIDQVHTLFLFVAIVVTGLGLAIAGTTQLLTKGVSHMFGSGALIAFGALGILLGVAGQEALSGANETGYMHFLAQHFMGISLVICALTGAHVIVERPIIKRRQTSAS